MAALQRSINDATAPFVFDREFCIEPEHLEIEEVKNELQARNLPASGDRRALTSKLRQCIIEEKRNPGTQPMYVVGTPTAEFEKCSRGMVRVKSLLEQVSLDTTTHERFMTVFLHYEGRVNRIPKNDKDLNLTDVIFKKNEEFSELYNEFIQKIKILAQTRQTNQQPNELNMGGNETHNTQPNGISDNNTKNMGGAIPRTNQAQSMQPSRSRDNTFNPTRGRGAHGQSRGGRGAFSNSRVQQNFSLQPPTTKMHGPQMTHSNPGQMTMFQGNASNGHQSVEVQKTQSHQNLQSQNDGLAMLRQILRTTRQDSVNTFYRATCHKLPRLRSIRVKECTHTRPIQMRITIRWLRALNEQDIGTVCYKWAFHPRISEKTEQTHYRVTWKLVNTNQTSNRRASATLMI